MHHKNIDLATADMQGVLARNPRLYEHEQSRWTLATIKATISWLKQSSLSGISRLLKRLAISYKRGRQTVHSPDLLYNEKVARIRQARLQVQREPHRFAFVYLDEHQVARNATIARSYSGRGQTAQPAQQYAGFNSMFRLMGAFDAHTGALISKRCYRADVKTFLLFLVQVEEQYPDVEELFIALDNWSVHVNKEVQASLDARHSKIRLLYLPTYAPWLNPIEKIWLKLNRERTHMHEYFEKTKPWREWVDQWLENMREGSQEILRETGVLLLVSLRLPTPESLLFPKVHL
ncbi:IS630 family transposase [Dictyobacter halimunensis]|uniref:IS630 family transposase n=1 Tax=Dictyobacter halimunensis TaxID=3026934 RepID=UPI0030C73FC0